MSWQDVTPQSEGWRYMSIASKNSYANLRTTPHVVSTNLKGTVTRTKIDGKVNTDKSVDDGTYNWLPIQIGDEILWVSESHVVIDYGELVDVPYFFDIDFTGTFPVRVTLAERDTAVGYLRILVELSKQLPDTKDSRVPELLEAYTDYLATLRKTSQ